MTQIGAELAKNFAMLTPAKLTLADDTLATNADSHLHWYQKGVQIGTKRSDQLAVSLRDLNPFVKPDALPMIAIDEEIVKTYNIFCLTDCFDSTLAEGWDVVCRKHGISFLLANCVGFLGSLFVDLVKLKVEDKYFLPKKSAFFIEKISNQKPGKVTLQKLGPRPFFEDGDYVSIASVQGMSQVNGTDPRPVKVVDSHSFTIESTLGYNKYEGGGIVTYEKVPTTVNFTEFRQNLSRPKLRSGFGSDRGCTQLELHVCMLIYYELREELEEEVCNVADMYTEDDLGQFIADIIVSRDVVKQLVVNHKLAAKKLKAIVMRMIAMRGGQFLPICQLVANFAACQLICLAGKLQPVDQLLYFDLTDAFPDSFVDSLAVADLNPLDHHLATFKQLVPGLLEHQSMK